MSPLFNNGHPGLVKLLLENGADPGIRTDHGLTPQDMAEEKGFTEISILLKQWQDKYPDS